MTRGFEAVLQKLNQKNFDSVGAMLQNIGTTLLMSIGGAAGAIFGTWFRGAATSLMDKMIFDSDALADMLTDGLSAVKDRGKAKLGDKTMVDALEPAACNATAMKGRPLGKRWRLPPRQPKTAWKIQKTWWPLWERPSLGRQGYRVPRSGSPVHAFNSKFDYFPEKKDKDKHSYQPGSLSDKKRR